MSALIKVILQKQILVILSLTSGTDFIKLNSIGFLPRFISDNYEKGYELASTAARLSCPILFLSLLLLKYIDPRS
jgi:hypothetical protein